MVVVKGVWGESYEVVQNSSNARDRTLCQVRRRRLVRRVIRLFGDALPIAVDAQHDDKECSSDAAEDHTRYGTTRDGLVRDRLNSRGWCNRAGYEANLANKDIVDTGDR